MRASRCRRALGLVALLFVVCTGCIPRLSNGGFTKARSPNRESITVDNSAALGFDVAKSVAAWNSIAGWDLLAPTPYGDSAAGASADIRFERMTPICRRGDCTQRLPYWVKPPVLNADGSIAYCVIAYDPTWLAGRQGQPDVVSHELGHCLGFGDPPADANASCSEWYKGVMSYCRFYDGMRDGGLPHVNWWQGDDRNMLATAGYR